MNSWSVYSLVFCFFCSVWCYAVHIIVYICRPSVLIAVASSVVWICCHWLVRSSVDGHLDSSQFGAVLNGASGNTLVYGCWWTEAHTAVEYILRSGISGSQGVCILSCMRKLPVFLVIPACIYLLPSVCESYPPSHPQFTDYFLSFSPQPFSWVCPGTMLWF